MSFRDLFIGTSSRLARGPRRRRGLLAGGAGALVLAAVLVATISAGTSSAHHVPLQRVDYQRADGLGIRPGKIKHVWLIILENKSYDASFTGLNNNTYLWQTLPAQGVLLKNYFGTGHFSLDNYISMVSGQATQPDTQEDCPFYDQFSGSVDTSGTLETNPDYGQVASAAGPNAIAGANGCVYGSTVQTLFNQLDAAHVSWKGYAQDLGTRPRATTRWARRHAARRSRRPEQPAARRRRTRGARTRPTSTSRSTSRSRGSSRCCSPATATRPTSPTCSTPATACTTTCRARAPRRRSAGSRRTTAATHTTPSARATTSRAASPDPNTPKRHAEEPHGRAVRGRPVPVPRHPRDREVARVQGRRPDRHHVRRGVPALHLHGQQLRELDAHRTERRRLDRVGHRW